MTLLTLAAVLGLVIGGRNLFFTPGVTMKIFCLVAFVQLGRLECFRRLEQKTSYLVQIIVLQSVKYLNWLHVVTSYISSSFLKRKHMN